MKIIDTTALTEEQIHKIKLLTDTCYAHDNIRLTYPWAESGDCCRHYLSYGEDGGLTAALAILALDDETMECSAFTHPDCRRQGYFTRLFEAAMERFEAYDILFGVPESCHAAVMALSALGAELESREHQMELVLPQTVLPSITDSGLHTNAQSRSESDSKNHSKTRGGLTLISQDSPIQCDSTENTPSTTTWALIQDETTIGHCLTTPVSDACVCLHRLEIAESLRRKGYGSSFLSLLLPRIAASGIRKIILQVSGDNEAAIALYKKTGFRITETLSYYCY